MGDVDLSVCGVCGQELHPGEVEVCGREEEGVALSHMVGGTLRTLGAQDELGIQDEKLDPGALRERCKRSERRVRLLLGSGPDEVACKILLSDPLGNDLLLSLRGIRNALGKIEKRDYFAFFSGRKDGELEKIKKELLGLEEQIGARERRALESLIERERNLMDLVALAEKRVKELEHENAEQGLTKIRGAVLRNKPVHIVHHNSREEIWRKFREAKLLLSNLEKLRDVSSEKSLLESLESRMEACEGRMRKLEGEFVVQERERKKKLDLSFLSFEKGGNPTRS